VPSPLVHFLLDEKTNQKNHGWEKFDPSGSASAAWSNFSKADKGADPRPGKSIGLPVDD
jgi:hypothetical protein